MLSSRIASRLRDMETPFYLYDTELLRQTLESVGNESKRYNYKVHFAIKANYDDRLLAIIREYGLGVDCASGNEVQKAIEAGFDPKSIVYAGVGKRDKELRYAIEQEIMAINCESIEALLVLDATTGQNGMTQAKVFAEAIGITGVVLSKLDGSAKGGIVISVQKELGVPVKLVGLGEGPDDLAPFDPEGFVDGILA